MVEFAGKVAPNLIGAFVGAFAAFRFNVKMNSEKEKKENLAYLSYSICSLGGLVNALYGIKRDFAIPKKNEADQIRKAMGNAAVENLNFNLKVLTLRMHFQGLSLPFNSEKLYYIAEKDPNVILLLSSLSNAIRNLNGIIFDYNEYISHLMKGVAPNRKEVLDVLFSYTDNLIAQANETMYLADKAQERLIFNGKAFFKKRFVIKKINIDEESNYLKPPAMQSWENIKWFENKNWFQRIQNKWFPLKSNI